MYIEYRSSEELIKRNYLKMVITKTMFIRELRDQFFFLLIALLQTFLMCPACDTIQRFGPIAALTFLIWNALWKGNSYLSHVLSRKVNWIHQPVKRLIFGIALTISYTVLAVVLLVEAFEYFSGTTLGRAYLYTLYGSIIITILISFFLHARSFLLSWRQASFEKERFEKESISARYEALKNQVSPHFLFNSLNALTNLVHEDPDKAVRFIKQLSDVYRYVLETREKELVPLAKELAFLESYLYLQQIRFGKKLDIELDLNPADIQVPPLALQMLIENAIKHNIISEEDPLTIRLYAENGYLVVENNLQKKPAIIEDTPGLGLANICKRYEFLSSSKVKISEEQNRFMVKLPVLYNSPNGHTDH